MINIALLLLLVVGTFLWLPLSATAQENGNLNIAAVGDWGCTENTEDTVDNIFSRDPELVLGLGDNSYDESADCWFETVDPILDRLVTAIGNHDDRVHVPGEGPANDVDSPELLEEYTDHFDIEDQYTSYVIDNVFIILMSQEVDFGPDSDQFDFIESELVRATSSPDIDWIFVMTHELLYASPGATNDGDALRNTYHPMFEAYGVDLVLQAHIHGYERTYPLEYNPDYGDDNIQEPIATDTDPDNDNTYVNPEGQIFATVGTGGQSIHEWLGQNPYVVTQFEGYGFLDILIEGDERLVATYYDNDGGGQIQDQFTIIKDDD